MAHRFVLLSDGAAPTEAIYCLAAREHLRAAGIRLEHVDARRRRPGRRPRRGSFERRLVGSTVIVCRSLAGDWIDWLAARRHALDRLVYLVDDDLSAAAACPELPDGYRARMAGAAQRQPRLIELADTVVVTSTVLHERLRGHHGDVRLLTPCLVAPLPGQRHFRRRRWTAGFHGTRAHVSDLAAIAPAIQGLHNERADLEFEVMLGRHTPRALHHCCRIHRPRHWRAYRRYLGRPRRHIGLVPLMSGPFNEAKSWIKFLEIASMGGVGVFSARPPYSEVVEHGVDGLLVGDEPEQWQDAVLRLVEQPGEARAMAERAAYKAAAVGDPATAGHFWRGLL